ncbi:MAG: disulfide bond formation protein B [Patescibacteria group bacterium]
MTPFAQNITFVISLGVVVLNILSVILLWILVLGTPDKKNKDLGSKIASHALVLSALIAIGGTIGSLIYSSVIGFIPCEFCWWARILLFPQAVLFFVAWFRSWKYKITDSAVYIYALVFSIMGVLVTGFHYYGQMFNPSLLDACIATGVSCSQIPFVEFGYITIPWMAFSTFVALALVIGIKLRFSK